MGPGADIWGRRPRKTNTRDMVYLSRPYHFKFFKGSLPQVLLGSLLNTLSQIILATQDSITLFWPQTS